MIAAIAAVAANGMLGREQWLPWDIPEELAYFERTVAGAALVMGRLTYASMDVVPEDSFVLSRAAELPLRAGCRRMPDIESALHAACATGKQVFVIGGASIYAAAWPYCRYFYLTRIEADFDGDTLLPAAIPLADWGLVQERQARYLERISGQSVNCRFQVYEQGNPRVLPGRVYG
ncbi:MAG TPA: dihydrofolate reductase [Rhodocyclaceae bacterium]|nr:dihydrofolate reductase [Rhodocyclaceae bacterium]